MEYEGAIYLVMNRGDRREPIVHAEGDARLFLETPGEGCPKTDWLVHAFCPRVHLTFSGVAPRG